uniref:RING-type domain-containing protein n=1 Tax=viral metagenome TaxID=1070528 RepID=A0A6C0B7C8_9ZZZZ
MNESEERELALNEFSRAIFEHLKYNSTYSFRAVTIDGVLCYPVIHKHRKIVNFECVNIYCHAKDKWGDKIKEHYSVYYKNYSTIRDAILTVEFVNKCFRIYNGDLMSPEDYKMAKMEEQFLPYNESQVCCICYENTLDTTLCDHYLCLRCREVCLNKCVTDCPMCRKQDIVSIYNIDNGLINNNVYTVLREVIEFERKQDAPNNDFVYLSSSVGEGVYAFIDRIGNRRSRSPSSESNLNENDQELSEVSTIYENEDESDELMPFDLSGLFEAALQSEPVTI